MTDDFVSNLELQEVNHTERKIALISGILYPRVRASYRLFNSLRTSWTAALMYVPTTRLI